MNPRFQSSAHDEIVAGFIGFVSGIGETISDP